MDTRRESAAVASGFWFHSAFPEALWARGSRPEAPQSRGCGCWSPSRVPDPCSGSQGQIRGHETGDQLSARPFPPRPKQPEDLAQKRLLSQAELPGAVPASHRPGLPRHTAGARRGWRGETAWLPQPGRARRGASAPSGPPSSGAPRQGRRRSAVPGPRRRTAPVGSRC